MNGISSKLADDIAKTVNNLFQSSEDLISKTHFTKFFPNLLDRIHLRGIRWDKKEFDVFWYDK